MRLEVLVHVPVVMMDVMSGGSCSYTDQIFQGPGSARQEEEKGKKV
jgi:hypothetical protein